MRIAVSGTHGIGKSTLIDEFLSAHPDFTHEPEPYTVLVEDYGEEFSSEPGVTDFYRQLEFNVERVQSHSSGERVIYERCPIDFLAYILALNDLKVEVADSCFLSAVVETVWTAMRDLDLVVFLPLDGASEIDSPDAEHPRLRKVVDAWLVNIFSDDEFGIVSAGNLMVVEARGSTATRLNTVELAMQTR